MNLVVEVPVAQGHLNLGHPNQAQDVVDQEQSDEKYHSR